MTEARWTIIASPHKILGPETNDLVLQLRKHDITQVILAGMAANLCLESHLRELVGYLAALVNFRFLAHAIWTTDETISHLQAATVAA